MQIDGNTLTVNEEGSFFYKFKAVSTAGLESYESPEYNVIIEKESFAVTLKTTVLEDLDAVDGTASLAGVTVYIDGEEAGVTDENGVLNCTLKQGEHTVEFNNKTFNRTAVISVAGECEYNMPMIALDADKDGYVNMRDYSLIYRNTDDPNCELYKEIFMRFINLSEATVSYA